MEKWLHEGLQNCLGFEVPDEMVKHILSITDSKAFDDYFENFLNQDCEDHRLFLADCKKRLLNINNNGKVQNNQKSKENLHKGNKKESGPGSSGIKQILSAKETRHKKQEHQPQQQQQQQGTKKKTKYVNLYTQDGKVAGETIMLKGRHHCDCQATQHNLVNNCMGCGRIVCEQEGSGPCLYCGEMVATNDEMQILRQKSKKSGVLLKMLQEKGGGESLRKALEQRDRLLEYDRNSEKRTTVIDDELDYFQENSVWLSDAERERFERLKQEMQEKKHESRIKRKIKVDFAGRVIEDDAPISEEYERKVLKELAEVSAMNNDSSNWSNRKHGQDDGRFDVDPNVDIVRPIYKEFEKATKTQNPTGLGGVYNRVQDKELVEMQDMRQCLSLHQPWASLLVAGIKKHEGRVWYTGHRGRLWIASTAKEPRTEEIQEMENFYKCYYNDSTIKFPEHYPSGCLLGCVKVEECLPQEQYRELYPNGESESPYVFVCSNFEQLPVVLPIRGQQKIYEIDPKIHNTACKILLRGKTTATKGQ